MYIPTQSEITTRRKKHTDDLCKQSILIPNTHAFGQHMVEALRILKVAGDTQFEATDLFKHQKKLN